jgi:hypothetical protein
VQIRIFGGFGSAFARSAKILERPVIKWAVSFVTDTVFVGFYGKLVLGFWVFGFAKTHCKSRRQDASYSPSPHLSISKVKHIRPEILGKLSISGQKFLAAGKKKIIHPLQNSYKVVLSIFYLSISGLRFQKYLSISGQAGYGICLSVVTRLPLGCWIVRSARSG